MARETKLGIALMVLLVGVFGFMVYKKWNSRQPTALAAAEEVKAAEGDLADKEPAAPSQGPETLADVSAEASGTSQMATAANPFGQPTATVPPRQAEPASAFADEPFVRDTMASASAASEVTAGAMTADPLPQNEPAIAESEPVFAEPTGAPAEDTAALDADAFVEATPKSQPSTTLSPDPFASADGTATSTGVTDVATKPNPASAAPDDPFAESADTAAVANVDPEMSMDEAAVSEPAFNDAASSEVASSESSEPDLFEASETADQAAVASADEPMTVDPFADAQPAPAAPSQSEGEPARLFAEATIDIEPDPLAPAEGADTFDEQATAAAVSTTVTPVARAQGQSYVVVGDNDSYWALSKRVYDTPAYFHALAKYNSSRIKDPNRLKAGMKVVTPEPKELESLFPHLISRTASGDATVQDAKAGLSWNEQGVPIYRVGDSDTLTGIAQAHLGRASRWVQIYEMNRKAVSDPKTLKPGTVLQLPADASRVRLVPQG